MSKYKTLNCQFLVQAQVATWKATTMFEEAKTIQIFMNKIKWKKNSRFLVPHKTESECVSFSLSLSLTQTISMCLYENVFVRYERERVNLGFSFGHLWWFFLRKGSESSSRHVLGQLSENILTCSDFDRTPQLLAWSRRRRRRWLVST